MTSPTDADRFDFIAAPAKGAAFFEDAARTVRALRPAGTAPADGDLAIDPGDAGPTGVLNIDWEI